MSLAPVGRTKVICWTITSKIDPRWDGKGESNGFVTISPHNANKHLEKCKKKYKKQPKDLMYKAHVN